MSSASSTEVKKPASWEDFPDYQNFWEAYLDIFWGAGGSTPYHEMLLQDEEWLKEVYLQNNSNLTQLEQSYINSVSGSTDEYLRGMDKQTLKITAPGGGASTSFVPSSAQRSLDARQKAQLLDSYEKYTAGQNQAGRIKEMGEKFTPNAANISFMEALRGEGEKGQALRAGMPITTSEGDVDMDTSLTPTDYVNLGSGVLNFLAKNPDVTKDIGEGISSAGSSLYDAGSDFWDWLWS